MTDSTKIADALLAESGAKFAAEKHLRTVELQAAIIKAKDAEIGRLRSAFHVNMLRAFPKVSHAVISAEIDKVLNSTMKSNELPGAQTDGMNGSDFAPHDRQHMSSPEMMAILDPWPCSRPANTAPIGYISRGVIEHALSKGFGASTYIQAGQPTGEFPVAIYTVAQEQAVSRVTGLAMTPEQVYAIRSTIKPGDGWDGDQWDVALANALLRHLSGATAEREG